MFLEQKKIVSLKPLYQRVAIHPQKTPRNRVSSLAVRCVFFSQETNGLRLLEFEVEQGTFQPGCGDVSSCKTVMNLEMILFVFLRCFTDSTMVNRHVSPSFGEHVFVCFPTTLIEQLEDYKGTPLLVADMNEDVVSRIYPPPRITVAK